MLGREIEALKDIKTCQKSSNFQYPYDFVPNVIGKGMFIFENPLGVGDSFS
jgi:hypothetical protein